MANEYVTTAEFKAERPDTTWGSTYDTLIASLCTRVSRYIDTLCLRPAGYFKAGTAAAKYFNGNGRQELWVDDMAAAPTIVAVAETGITDGAGGTGGSYTTWAATDYYCWPMNAAADGNPYTALVVDTINGSKAMWYGYPRGVKITAQWGGYTTVPDDIHQVALAEVTRIYEKARQNYRDTGGIIELGKITYTKAIDPISALIIAKYKKVSV